VGVDFRRRYVLVTEQLLNQANIGACFEHMGRERVLLIPSSE
jgi:hypothetical protein